MEHVVRTSDSMSSPHVSLCLKAFSGRIPRPSHEPDFDTWRATVDFLLNDQSPSDLHKTGKILDSLLPPASDVVKHIGPCALPSECLKLLESVYASVEDGDELFAKFIGALQNQGEKTSSYLHCLHVMLSTAIRRGGVAEAEKNRCLLKQFCRGCWDNSLIIDLQLEGKRSTPPPFAELVVLIRTAEDKQSLKEERMRKHFGLNKQVSVPFKLRTATNQQFVYCSEMPDEPNEAESCQLSVKQKAAKSRSKAENSEIQSLKKEISKLQTQITMMKNEPVRKEKNSPNVDGISELRQQIAELQAHLILRESPPVLSAFPAKHRPKLTETEVITNPKPIGQLYNRPRPGYCFHCGGDGHLAVNCENDPNPRKVEEKRRELRERQAKWDLQNAPNSSNCTQGNRPILKSHCYGYQAVINILEKRRQQASSGAVGPEKLKGNQQEVVPAGCTIVLDGLVQVKGPLFEKWVSVEPATTSPLPGGLLVASCLHSLPSRQCLAQLPVVLRNDSHVDLMIPPKAVIAEVHTVRQVEKEFSKVDTESKKTESILLKVPVDFGDSPLPPEWKKRITSMLNSMPDVFSLHDLDYDVDAVRKHLQELLDAGVIRESESPFSSPIVVVRKKNNSVRLCIDFKKLNSQTIKDAYALPNLEEAFSDLTGSKWISVLDLKSGYYQIEMEESDKQKTAFVCPLGFWEFNRMPQGISNAPSTFQRLMERCMGDLNRKEVLVFIDDLIVFSRTLEEHQTRLMQVLKRLREFGLKLSPEKCKFCQTSVRYLGHIVSQHGVETDPAKVEALKTWPRQRNLKELRSFLSFSGYYRRFVQDFLKIVKPLNGLTAGYPPLQKGSRKIKTDERKQYFNLKEQFGERWTQDCQHAFDTVLAKLTSAPVLGFADPKLLYVLHTDASTTGLDAALYQEKDGQMRIIAFTSRGLTRSESKYPAHKLEFLALKWAVTTKFNDYLYGAEFTVITDSNPLTYLLTSAKLDATSYRWLSSLSTFTFKIWYRAGSRNQDADGLSRRPQTEIPDDLETQKERERIRQFTHQHLTEEPSMVVSKEAVRAICERHQIGQPCDDHDHPHPSVTLVESLTVDVDALPQAFQQDDAYQIAEIPQLSEENLMESQRADPEIGIVVQRKALFQDHST
ncbi:hypothetical protein QQF64_031862 [Cirrhinus molitorella]|uniref:ribonuclease H n=1 Tax=Cirrhinus molitorella TaxID=172907 RepID=A0ABR3MY57_9TELE